MATHLPKEATLQTPNTPEASPLKLTNVHQILVASWVQVSCRANKTTGEDKNKNSVGSNAKFNSHFPFLYLLLFPYFRIEFKY